MVGSRQTRIQWMPALRKMLVMVSSASFANFSFCHLFVAADQLCVGAHPCGKAEDVTGSAVDTADACNVGEGTGFRRENSEAD